MSKANYISTAGITAGLVYSKFIERMDKQVPALNKVTTLRFCITIRFYEIPSKDKNYSQSEWKELAAIVANYVEQYAKMYDHKYDCKITSSVNSSFIVFSFNFTEIEKPKKLTVSEVEKLLGYKVEIIS